MKVLKQFYSKATQVVCRKSRWSLEYRQFNLGPSSDPKSIKQLESIESFGSCSLIICLILAVFCWLMIFSLLAFFGSLLRISSRNS